MAKVKYLSKLWLPDNYILIDNTYNHCSERIISADINEMIDLLKEKYIAIGCRNTSTNYIKIGIYNLDANNEIADIYSIDTTYKDSKNVLCKYARYRAIYLSPNLTQIYSEFFHLYMPSGLDWGFECRYDYGILYGNYPYIKPGTIVHSSYIPKKDLEIDHFRNAVINRKDEKYEVGMDVNMFYCAWYDNDKEYPYKFEDGCVPVSTMRIIKEANENDN